MVLISDRGDQYLPWCVESLNTHIQYPVAQTVLVSDEAHEYTASGAVNQAWSEIGDDIDYVVHVEEDFVLTAPLDVDAMCDVLDTYASLAHLVLKRQPWNSEEIAAGGIIEQRPHDYVDRPGWVEHTNFFSLNPSIVPRRVFAQGFPEGSEPAQTQRLLEHGYVFGFWGGRYDEPRCHHIGEHRHPQSRR